MKHFSKHFWKKHVKVTRQILIGKYAPLFSNTRIANDVYVYYIDANVIEFSEGLFCIECEDYKQWFQIRKFNITKEIVGNYGLFTM